MPFQLDHVIPWGRSYDEYVRMFALSEGDLKGKILDVAGGPASFCAEASARGVRVVAADPIYSFTGETIQARIEACFDTVLEQCAKNRDDFVWDLIPSIDELAAIRRRAMTQFIGDYRNGGRTRYIAATLPELPFRKASFDLALCSHFLFLYSEHFDLRFHVSALDALLDVAREVRIFPLLNLARMVSPHLQPLMEHAIRRGHRVECTRVPYEFQKGGHTMLRVHRH